MLDWHYRKYNPQFQGAEELLDTRDNRNDVKADVRTHLPSPEVIGNRESSKHLEAVISWNRNNCLWVKGTPENHKQKFPLTVTAEIMQ